MTMQCDHVGAACADMPPCFAAFFADPPRLPSVADVMACLRSEKVCRTPFSAPELTALLRAPRDPELFCAMVPWLRKCGLDAAFGRDWLTAALGLRDFAALRAVFDAGLVTIDAFTQEITAELLLLGGEFALAAPRCGVAFAPTQLSAGLSRALNATDAMRTRFREESDPHARLHIANDIVDLLSSKDIASVFAADPRSSRDFWPDGLDARARYFFSALRSGDPVACMMLPDLDFDAFPWRDVLQAAVDGGLQSLLWLRRCLLDRHAYGSFPPSENRPLEARLFDLLPELALEAVRASVFDVPDRAERDRDVVVWCLSLTSPGCKRLTSRCGLELGGHCEFCSRAFSDRVCVRFLEVVDRYPSRMPEYIELFLAAVPRSVLTDLINRGVFILAALRLRNLDLLKIVAPLSGGPVFGAPLDVPVRARVLMEAASCDVRMLPHLFERMPERAYLVKHIIRMTLPESDVRGRMLKQRFLRWHDRVWSVHACCCS